MSRVLLALILACWSGIVAVRGAPLNLTEFIPTIAAPNTTFSVYYGNWDIYARNYTIADLPIDYIPELDYAFVNVNETTPGSGEYHIVSSDPNADSLAEFPDNANLTTHGNLGSLMALKQAGKEFKLKLALGGYVMSNNFSPAMATDNSRKSLVASIVQFFNDFPIFGGLSIDWEYVSNDGVNYGAPGNNVSTSDSDNLILFLQQLRTALTDDDKGDYEVAICATAIPDKAKFDAKAIAELVDVFHVMTYDFASSSWGDTTTTHQANLYPTSYAPISASGAVEYYLGQGVPANKIMIGVAMYSRGFANTAGLGSPGSGVVSVKSWEDGVADYKVLPPQGFVEMWDDKAQATYAYSASKKEFLSYDSVRSVKAKCAYVRTQGLRGIVAWEASGDTSITDTSRSLIYALHQGLVASPGSEWSYNSGVPPPLPLEFVPANSSDAPPLSWFESPADSYAVPLPSPQSPANTDAVPVPQPQSQVNTNAVPLPQPQSPANTNAVPPPTVNVPSGTPSANGVPAPNVSANAPAANSVPASNTPANAPDASGVQIAP